MQDTAVEYTLAGSSLIRVKNSRKTLGLMASQLYDNPSCKLKMIGVTGTNGKTTVTHLAKSLLEAQGSSGGITWDCRVMWWGKSIVRPHIQHQLLYNFRKCLAKWFRAGSDVGVLEVSSHALELDRVAGCEFDIVVFTNLTQDHLDFHHTMERYFQSKLHLFTDYVDRRPKNGAQAGVGECGRSVDSTYS